MAVESSPLYPIAGETTVALSLTAASVSANTQVWELTSKPAASTLELGFLQKPGARRRQRLATPIVTTTSTTSTTATHRQTPVTAMTIAETETQIATFTPDVAGEYGFKCHEINAYTGAPSYVGDPAGEMRWLYVTSQTGTVHVGAHRRLPLLTTTGRGATLRLLVVDETVRAAELVDPLDALSTTAALDASVVSALDACVGVAVSAVGADLQTAANDLRTKVRAHVVFTTGSVHGNTDPASDIVRFGATSQTNVPDLVNEIRSKLVDSHMLTTSSGSRHHASSDDTKNLPLAPRATTLGGATVLLADLRWRVYNRHRLQIASPAAHGGSGDTTNTLTVAQAPLETVIVNYFDVLAALDPSAAAGESEGALDLGARYGFD